MLEDPGIIHVAAETLNHMMNQLIGANPDITPFALIDEDDIKNAAETIEEPAPIISSLSAVRSYSPSPFASGNAFLKIDETKQQTERQKELQTLKSKLKNLQDKHREDGDNYWPGDPLGQ